MKKTILAACIAVAGGAAALAATELVETMTVKLTDGTTVEYKVTDVEKVSFDTKTVSVLGENYFKYFNADGEQTNQGDITGAKKTVLKNGWWKVEFANEQDLKISIELDPSLVGEVVNFAARTNAGFNFRYDNIQVSGPNDEYRNVGLKGVFCLEDNGDGTLNFKADVTNLYSNSYTTNGGTPERVEIEYTGACEGLEVAPVVKEDYFEYFNADGELTNQGDITGAKKTVLKNGWWKVEFANSQDLKISIELDPSLVGEVVNFAARAEAGFNFRYDNIQVSGPNDEYRNVGLKGAFCLEDNGDGTLKFTADVTNLYSNSYTTSGGTPERVKIEYEGACEGLEVAPVVKEDYFEYFNADGELTNQGDITGAKKTVLKNGWWKVEFTNSQNLKISIELDPSLVGEVVNFAARAEAGFNFRYDNIQVSGPNDEYRNVGLKGAFCLEDNGDGTLKFTADVTNLYSNSYTTNGGTPERVKIEYEGACEGLESAPQIKNEITFFDPDGAQENYTTVSAVSYKTAQGGALSQYTFTVDNAELAADYGKKFYIQIDPTLVGETVDVPTSTKTINCYFAFIQVSGPNNEYRPVAKAGTVKIVDNNDGNVTIEADLTESGNRRVVFTYSGLLTK